MTTGCYDDITLRFPSATMDLVAISDGRSLVGLRFGRSGEHPVRLKEATRDGDDPVIVAARRQLEEYAAGRRQDFDLPLAPAGTEFQAAVWEELRKIPYGTTTTYGTIAAALGRPRHARAVGAAVGANPIGIVIPCHRVVGAGGALTGFGGGLDNKVVLLTSEGAAGR